MKAIETLVRESLKNLKPCVHGAEVLGAAQETGLNPQDIIDFSSSVNPLGPSKKALFAAKRAFSQIAAYPDSNSNQLRQTLADHFKLNKKNIVIGNGSTELMYLFTEAFLKNGETVIIPAPTFGEYEGATCKAGATPKFIKLNTKFRLEKEPFKRAITGAKLVFLCNPNNPTSMLIEQEILKDIIENALDQDTLVFLDEDFMEFVDNEKSLSMVSNIKKYPNLFILRSFTKIFGLTGLRVGYGIASEEIIEILMNAKIPWNVNCLAQAAAVTALKDETHLRVTRELIRREKAWLSNELEKFKTFNIYPPAANFFFIDIRQTGIKATELKTRLLKQGILIRDCTSFKGIDEYYVRIAVKTHKENKQLIEALKQQIKRMS